MSPRKRGLAEDAATTSIDQVCRMLRLPSIRGSSPNSPKVPPRSDVVSGLPRGTTDGRVRRSGPPPLRAPDQGRRLAPGQVAAGLRLRGQPERRPATCDRGKEGEPLCVIGDSGTGKSHLLIALGTEAAMNGFRVRYVPATKLVNELVEAPGEKQLSKTIARFPGGRRRSRALDSAQPSSTGSPSTAPSSRPAPSPTASPTPKHRPNAPPADPVVSLVRDQSLRPVAATVTPRPIIVSPPTPPTRESR